MNCPTCKVRLRSEWAKDGKCAVCGTEVDIPKAPPAPKPTVKTTAKK